MSKEKSSSLIGFVGSFFWRTRDESDNESMDVEEVVNEIVESNDLNQTENGNSDDQDLESVKSSVKSLNHDSQSQVSDEIHTDSDRVLYKGEYLDDMNYRTLQQHLSDLHIKAKGSREVLMERLRLAVVSGAAPRLEYKAKLRSGTPNRNTSKGKKSSDSMSSSRSTVKPTRIVSTTSSQVAPRTEPRKSHKDANSNSQLTIKTPQYKSSNKFEDNEGNMDVDEDGSDTYYSPQTAQYPPPNPSQLQLQTFSSDLSLSLRTSSSSSKLHLPPPPSFSSNASSITNTTNGNYCQSSEEDTLNQYVSIPKDTIDNLVKSCDVIPSRGQADTAVIVANLTQPTEIIHSISETTSTQSVVVKEQISELKSSVDKIDTNEQLKTNAPPLPLPPVISDAVNAVGSRFISVLRGEGPALSDTEYSFFQTLLDSKRLPTATAGQGTEAHVHVATSPRVVVSAPIAVVEGNKEVNTVLKMDGNLIGKKIIEIQDLSSAEYDNDRTSVPVHRNTSVFNQSSSKDEAWKYNDNRVVSMTSSENDNYVSNINTSTTLVSKDDVTSSKKRSINSVTFGQVNQRQNTTESDKYQGRKSFDDVANLTDIRQAYDMRGDDEDDVYDEEQVYKKTRNSDEQEQFSVSPALKLNMPTRVTQQAHRPSVPLSSYVSAGKMPRTSLDDEVNYHASGPRSMLAPSPYYNQNVPVLASTPSQVSSQAFTPRFQENAARFSDFHIPSPAIANRVVGRPGGGMSNAVVSSIQRRRMQRREEIGLTQGAGSTPYAKSGAVAKRILEALGDMTGSLDDQRSKLIPSGRINQQQMPAIQSTIQNNAKSQNEVRFAVPESASTARSNASLQSRGAPERLINNIPTKASTNRYSIDSQQSHNDSYGKSSRLSSSSYGSTEPMEDEDIVQSVNDTPAIPGNKQLKKALFDKSPDISKNGSVVRESGVNDSDEFSFVVPSDVSGLELLQSDYQASSDFSGYPINFAFSPPTKSKSRRKSISSTASDAVVSKEEVKPSKPAVSKSESSDVASTVASSSGSNAFKSMWEKAAQMWKCEVCLISNENSVAKCIACENPKGTPATMGGAPVVEFASAPKKTDMLSSSSSSSVSFGSKPSAASLPSSSAIGNGGFVFGMCVL